MYVKGSFGSNASMDLQINTIAMNRNVKSIPSTFSFEATY